MIFTYLVTFCLGGVASQLAFDLDAREKARKLAKRLVSFRKGKTQEAPPNFAEDNSA